MFNNNFGVSSGSNSKNDISVNTRIRTFYSNLSMLQLSYWNENLSIKLHPVTGTSADGLRQYDYNNKTTTAITPDKALALTSLIEKKIFPIRKEYEDKGKFSGPCNVGITIPSKNIAICVEYKEDANNSNTPTFYLNVYTQVGEDGKAAKETTKTYQFAKIPVIIGYDPETGNIAETKMVDSEFDFFFEKLKSVADIAGTAAHSVSVENAWKSIIQNRSSNGNFGHNSSGSYSTAQPQNSYSAPVSNFSDDDFSFVAEK